MGEKHIGQVTTTALSIREGCLLQGVVCHVKDRYTFVMERGICCGGEQQVSNEGEKFRSKRQSVMCKDSDWPGLLECKARE